MKIVGLTGYSGVGKDTVADYLVREHGYIKLAFADPLKKALAVLNPWVTFQRDESPVRFQAHLALVGWDKAKKSPEVRRLLQVFGTEVGREMFGQNFWIDQLRHRLWKIGNGITLPEKVVIPDVRFDNEASFIRGHVDESTWACLGCVSQGVLIRIEREGVGPLSQHVSENELSGDRVIYNNGSIEDLHESVFNTLTGDGKGWV